MASEVELEVEVEAPAPESTLAQKPDGIIGNTKQDEQGKNEVGLLNGNNDNTNGECFLYLPCVEKDALEGNGALSESLLDQGESTLHEINNKEDVIEKSETTLANKKITYNQSLDVDAKGTSKQVTHDEGKENEEDENEGNSLVKKAIPLMDNSQVLISTTINNEKEVAISLPETTILVGENRCFEEVGQGTKLENKSSSIFQEKLDDETQDEDKKPQCIKNTPEANAEGITSILDSDSSLSNESVERAEEIGKPNTYVEKVEEKDEKVISQVSRSREFTSSEGNVNEEATIKDNKFEASKVDDRESAETSELESEAKQETRNSEQVMETSVERVASKNKLQQNDVASEVKVESNENLQEDDIEQEASAETIQQSLQGSNPGDDELIVVDNKEPHGAENSDTSNLIEKEGNQTTLSEDQNHEKRDMKDSTAIDLVDDIGKTEASNAQEEPNQDMSKDNAIEEILVAAKLEIEDETGISEDNATEANMNGITIVSEGDPSKEDFALSDEPLEKKEEIQKSSSKTEPMEEDKQESEVPIKPAKDDDKEQCIKETYADFSTEKERDESTLSYELTHEKNDVEDSEIRDHPDASIEKEPANVEQDNINMSEHNANKETTEDVDDEIEELAPEKIGEHEENNSPESTCEPEVSPVEYAGELACSLEEKIKNANHSQELKVKMDNSIMSREDDGQVDQSPLLNDSDDKPSNTLAMSNGECNQVISTGGSKIDIEGLMKEDNQSYTQISDCSCTTLNCSEEVVDATLEQNGDKQNLQQLDLENVQAINEEGSNVTPNAPKDDFALQLPTQHSTQIYHSVDEKSKHVGKQTIEPTMEDDKCGSQSSNLDKDEEESASSIEDVAAEEKLLINWGPIAPDFIEVGEKEIIIEGTSSLVESSSQDDKEAVEKEIILEKEPHPIGNPSMDDLSEGNIASVTATDSKHVPSGEENEGVIHISHMTSTEEEVTINNEEAQVVNLEVVEENVQHIIDRAREAELEKSNIMDDDCYQKCNEKKIATLDITKIQKDEEEAHECCSSNENQETHAVKDEEKRRNSELEENNCESSTEHDEHATVSSDDVNNPLLGVQKESTFVKQLENVDDDDSSNIVGANGDSKNTTNSVPTEEEEHNDNQDSSVVEIERRLKGCMELNEKIEDIIKEANDDDLQDIVEKEEKLDDANVDSLKQHDKISTSQHNNTKVPNNEDAHGQSEFQENNKERDKDYVDQKFQECITTNEEESQESITTSLRHDEYTIISRDGDHVIDAQEESEIKEQYKNLEDDASRINSDSVKENLQPADDNVKDIRCCIKSVDTSDKSITSDEGSKSIEHEIQEEDNSYQDLSITVISDQFVGVHNYTGKGEDMNQCLSTMEEAMELKLNEETQSMTKEDPSENFQQVVDNENKEKFVDAKVDFEQNDKESTAQISNNELMFNVTTHDESGFKVIHANETRNEEFSDKKNEEINSSNQAVNQENSEEPPSQGDYTAVIDDVNHVAKVHEDLTTAKLQEKIEEEDNRQKVDDFSTIENLEVGAQLKKLEGSSEIVAPNEKISSDEAFMAGNEETNVEMEIQKANYVETQYREDTILSIHDEETYTTEWSIGKTEEVYQANEAASGYGKPDECESKTLKEELLRAITREQVMNEDMCMEIEVDVLDPTTKGDTSRLESPELQRDVNSQVLGVDKCEQISNSRIEAVEQNVPDVIETRHSMTMHNASIKEVQSNQKKTESPDSAEGIITEVAGYGNEQYSATAFENPCELIMVNPQLTSEGTHYNKVSVQDEDNKELMAIQQIENATKQENTNIPCKLMGETIDFNLGKRPLEEPTKGASTQFKHAGSNVITLQQEESHTTSLQIEEADESSTSGRLTETNINSIPVDSGNVVTKTYQTGGNKTEKEDQATMFKEENRARKATIVEEQKTDEEKDESIAQSEEDWDKEILITTEAVREMELRVTQKKSHNILSGVGSKVKHSISKMKKVIACSSTQFSQEDVIIKVNKNKKA